MNRNEYEKRKKLLNKTKYMPFGYIIGVIIYTIITGDLIACCVATLIGIIALIIGLLYVKLLPRETKPPIKRGVKRSRSMLFFFACILMLVGLINSVLFFFINENAYPSVIAIYVMYALILMMFVILVVYIMFSKQFSNVKKNIKEV